MVTYRKQRGFTLMEMLISLTLLGIISALSIMTIASNNGSRLALERTKSMAEMLVKARTSYKASFGEQVPRAFDLADLTKFTGTSHAVAGRFTATMACPAGMTLDSMECTGTGGCYCYRFEDGGILQAANPLATTNVLRFTYDPDGTSTIGNQAPVSLRMNFDVGRIRTMGSDTGVATDDPAYVREWTRF